MNDSKILDKVYFSQLIFCQNKIYTNYLGMFFSIREMENTIFENTCADEIVSAGFNEIGS